MRVFRKEFDRRLYRLYKTLDEYFKTGHKGNVTSCIFSCMTYLYCQSPFKDVPEK